ncbi:hypothetical protein IJJ08_00080 [bacterium]|nr:hypothetical protein [bacterium]
MSKTDSEINKLLDSGLSYSNAAEEKTQKEITKGESDTRNNIAVNLTNAFVHISAFVIIVGIASLVFNNQVVNIKQILDSFGSYFNVVLSFVLGYYFGKDKK